MYTNFLGSIGEVKDPAMCITAIKNMSGCEDFDLGYLNIYHESVSDSILYFNEKGNQMAEADGEKRARYKLVDTGYKKKVNGETIYASFTRGRIGWDGAYVEDLANLQLKMKKFFNTALKPVEEQEVAIEEPLERKAKTGDKRLTKQVLDKLLSRLVDKELFEVPKDSKCNKMDDNDRLVYYLGTFIQKAMWMVKRGESGQYIINQEKTMLCVNTALTDKYMRDIYVLAKINMEWFEYELLDVIDSKSTLVEAGFSKEDVRVMPDILPLYIKKEQLIFSEGIDSFDMDNYGRISHILNDRKDRLPCEIAKLSEDAIMARIKESVEVALKMQKRDYKYIVPMYNTKEDRISYLLPLYLGKSVYDKPELAAIVTEGDCGFYEIATVISISDAYDCARPLARPDNCWLNWLNCEKVADTEGIDSGVA